MTTLRPQRVPTTSIWLWFREALALCRREPLWFFGVSASWAAVWYLPLPFTFLLLLGLPLPLAAGCLIAHAADASRSPLELLRAASLRVWRDVLIAGAAPWIAVIAMIWTVAVLTMPVALWATGDVEPLLKLPASAPREWQAFRDLFGVIFLWLCTLGFVGWFQIPLMTIAGLPVLQAYAETVRGLALNWFVVGLVFFIACVGVPLLAFLSPLLAAPLLALLSSTMYVSFRHVWLGQGKNEPARAAMSERLELSPVPAR